MFTETARRAQIMAAAIDTIAELGYGQASLARIAEAAGTSKGVIIYHFGGKDELIRELLQDLITRAGAYMRPRIEAEQTGACMLRAFFESNLAFMAENRNQMAATVEIALNARAADAARLRPAVPRTPCPRCGKSSSTSRAPASSAPTSPRRWSARASGRVDTETAAHPTRTDVRAHARSSPACFSAPPRRGDPPAAHGHPDRDMTHGGQLRRRSRWPVSRDTLIDRAVGRSPLSGQPGTVPALRATPMIRGATGEKAADGGKRKPRHRSMVKTRAIADCVRRSTWQPPIRRGQMRSATHW